MRTPNNERVSSDIVEAPRARKSEPERKCILSGEHGAREQLVRLRLRRDGSVSVEPRPLTAAAGCAAP